MTAPRLVQRSLVRLALLGLAPRRPLRVVSSPDAPSGDEDELVTLAGGGDVAARAVAVARARSGRLHALAIAVSSESAAAIAGLTHAPEPARGAPDGWRAAMAWARDAPDEPDAPALDAAALDDVAAQLAELGLTCVEPDASLLVPGLAPLRPLLARPVDRVITQLNVLGERHRPVLFVPAAAARRARTRAESLGEPWAAPRRPRPTPERAPTATVSTPTASDPTPLGAGLVALELVLRADAPVPFKDLLRAAREEAQRRSPTFRVSRDDADEVRRTLTSAYLLGEIELLALPPDARAAG
ncbi:MAG: hypothetical protein R3B36_33065 [Polyangiaceae bacterium]